LLCKSHEAPTCRSSSWGMSANMAPNGDWIGRKWGQNEIVVTNYWVYPLWICLKILGFTPMYRYSFLGTLMIIHVIDLGAFFSDKRHIPKKQQSTSRPLFSVSPQRDLDKNVKKKNIKHSNTPSYFYFIFNSSFSQFSFTKSLSHESKPWDPRYPKIAG
jgi:hypothetical protein